MNENEANSMDVEAFDGPRLSELGWRDFFNDQVKAKEFHTTIPVRVIAVHRNGIQVLGTQVDTSLQRFAGEHDEDIATIGDWLLLDASTHRALRRLDRISVFKRKSPGTGRGVQLIATNVDTLIIVSSCNLDFNVARLERYLALALEAEVTPVLVLTKADEIEEPEEYRLAAQKLMPDLCIEILNATDPAAVEVLRPWCGAGQTIAFVGSSGVGKSTLANSLMGNLNIATGDVRTSDFKGRHTTTHRALYQLPIGGWVLDTPGIRELQLTDVSHGLADVFSDVEALIAACKFSDCKHDTEPGCAVKAAIAAGELDPERLDRWIKLVAENEQNSKILVQSRHKGRPKHK